MRLSIPFGLLLATSGFTQNGSTARIERPAMLPQAIASFGAAAPGDGWAYVFGRHIGRAPAHSKRNVVGSFRRLNLVDGHSWQELPSGPKLQGTSLVAFDGKLWRVGGVMGFCE